MAKKPIKPVHPGLYLKELLDELNISQYRLAKDLGIPAMRINYVINGKRPVNAELAMSWGDILPRSRVIGLIYKVATIWILLKMHWRTRLLGKFIL